MKKSILSASLSLLTSVCVASNPASTAYVDNKFAGIQKQIDAINATPAPTPPAQVPSVGSCYEGGVVIYVNTTPGAPAGQRGLIAALSDAGSSATYEWATPAPSSSFTSTALFTGESNTNAMVAYGAITGHTAPAATAAYNYPSGITPEGWFLPSQDELMTVYVQWNSNPSLFTNCGGSNPLTAGPSYWSSSQLSGYPGYAWYVIFGNGTVLGNGVSTSLLVRPVRAF